MFFQRIRISIANKPYIFVIFPDIANGIKPGSNSKKTNKHAADCSKDVRGDVN